MKTKLWAIGLMILCTLFTSTAQILLKFAADSLDFTLISLITNLYLIGGLFLYGVGALLLFAALRGGEVVTLYPILTSSYIWVTIASSWFFNDTITFSRWVGILFIIVGVLFVVYEKKEIIEKVEEVETVGASM